MIAKLAVSGNDLIDRPYDGVDRYILDGELRENPSGAIDSATRELMTVRNRFHSRASSATAPESTSPRGLGEIATKYRVREMRVFASLSIPNSPSASM